jgi:tRNA dimethylallyltransferase
LASETNKLLLVISGPTAIGKTQLAVELAKHFNTEVISADSRQFFHEMKVGTARPDLSELQGVKHHLLGSISIHDEFNAADFEKEALAILEDLFQSKNLVILCGGSGLYIDAVCKGFDNIPETTLETRTLLKEIHDKRGLDELLRLLKERDPSYYEQVDRNNPQRIIRALEVCLDTGLPYSSFRKSIPKKRNFSILKIALETNRDLLYEKINQRVDIMMEKGLLEEAKALYPHKHINALQTVGYKELFDYFDKKITLEEAIDLIKRNTRRYAKRQLTWLNRDSESHRISPDNPEKIIELVERFSY